MKYYDKALSLLQAAHDACFKSEDRDVLGMSHGPFSGVNEVLGIIKLLEEENEILKKRKSVLQDWVMELPLREQGTLLTGIRGCDLAPKPALVCEETSERKLVAFLRYCVMHPADPREVDIPHAFFRSTPPEDWKPSQFGHYPQHWYSHIMHCFEVVGYRKPNQQLANIAFNIYRRLVENMHLRVETKDEMIERLSIDRIKSGEVVS